MLFLGQIQLRTKLFLRKVKNQTVLAVFCCIRLHLGRTLISVVFLLFSRGPLPTLRVYVLVRVAKWVNDTLVRHWKRECSYIQMLEKLCFPTARTPMTNDDRAHVFFQQFLAKEHESLTSLQHTS